MAQQQPSADEMSVSENDLESVDQVRVRVLPDGRMTRKDAAAYLGRKPKTLAMWELDGKGPKSVKVGGRRFYFKSVQHAYNFGLAAKIPPPPTPPAGSPHR